MIPQMTADGTYTVKISDVYGYSKQVTFTIDSTYPAAPEIKVSETKLTNENVNVTVTYPNVPEAATDVARYYKVDDEVITVDGTEYTTDLDHNAKVYAYYTYTLAGETITSATAFKNIDNIDKETPVISVKSNEPGVTEIDGRTSAESAIISVSDNNEVSNITYTVNGSNLITTSDEIITISARGKYVITAADKAGNTSTSEFTLVNKPSLETIPEVISGQTVKDPVTITALGENAKLYIDGADLGTDTTTLSASRPYTVASRDIYGSEETIRFTINQSLLDAPIISVDNDRPVNLKDGEKLTVSVKLPSTVEDEDQCIIYYNTSADSARREYSETDKISVTENVTVYAWYVYGVSTSSAVAALKVNNIDRIDPVLNITPNEK